MSINIWTLYWMLNTTLFFVFKVIYSARENIFDLEKLDLENMTHILKNLSRSYDIRLRPGFGACAIDNIFLSGKYNFVTEISSSRSCISPTVARYCYRLDLFEPYRLHCRLMRLDVTGCITGCIMRPSLDLDMELSIASFESISEVNMDYTLTLYLRQYWRDERLAFAPNTNIQITLSGDFANQIWVPDTFLANDKHSFLHDVTEKNKMVRLSGDGSIEYGMRFTTTLACMMDLHYYPLDTQNCSVEIESYGYTTADVVMRWKNGTHSIHHVTGIDIPQFTIVRYNTNSTLVTLATGSYQRLFLFFIMKRNIGYFVFQTYLPCILIVMLSWVSFWINHEATSARVALGITTVLTMTTISTGVRSNLPRISYVKAIDIYLVKCFVFVFAALLEYALVNYTYWGARAKKKAKKFKQQTGTDIRQPRTIYSDGGMLGFDELRMSPIPSLRKRQMQNSFGPAGLHVDSNAVNASISRRAIPPSSMNPRAVNYPPPKVQYSDYGRRPRPIVGSTAKKRRMFHSVRKRFTTMQKGLPKIQDVNKIDRYSRLCFPLTFFICNLVYWCFYTFI